jgi:anti-anti-sigma regulatory factor
MQPLPFHTAVSPSPSPPLVLDLGDLDVLTADRLGRLVALHNRLRGSGGRLVLCNVGGAAYEALEVTGLTGLLEVRREHAGGPRTGR